MDPYEATDVLFTKIKSLDPENAPRIMGYLLIQDLGERDLMRLAFGPETLLHALILKAKTLLGLSSNTLSTPSSPSSPYPLNPISRPNANNNSNPLSQSSPRIPNNGFVDFTKIPTSPSSHSWRPSGLPNNNPISPKSSPFLSYDNIRAGSFMPPPFSHHKNGGDSSSSGDFVDEYQLNDYLSFLNDSSSKNEEFIDPRLQFGYSVNNGDTHLHRRSHSASAACFGSEDASFGIGYKPCLYFARGFCKNGDNCKFVHGGFVDYVDVNGAIVGSPSKIDTLLPHEEILRMKAAEQQRLAASQFPPGALPSSDKSMSFLMQQQNEPQRAAAAALMMEEFYKFGRFQPERNDMLAMGLGEKVNSASRQIYLTFPADSTFKDEDVSNYFSNFGPVQDVRIPYQQKRMFGFVTFVHPGTVKLILARGNPHFICDSRVLVKPYKEKGKVADKRQQHLHQQPLDRGSFSPSSSPSGLDSREHYDLYPGAKMFYHSQEMMLRRKLEQVDLQQAIEHQRRRFMNLQLPDLKNHSVLHHQRSLSVGAPVSMPSYTHANQNVILPFDGINQEVTEVNGDNLAAISYSNAAAAEGQLQPEVNAACIQGSGCGNSKEESANPEGSDVHEWHESSVEQVLPDNLFSSPKKSAEARLSEFSLLAEVNENTAFSATLTPSERNPALANNSTSGMASQ